MHIWIWGRCLVQNNVFRCDKCGLCCQNLNRSSLYDDLNDGNGVCVYYDKMTHLCRIYNERPDKCNIQKAYKFFSDIYTYDEYLQLNYMSCKVLKGEI